MLYPGPRTTSWQSLSSDLSEQSAIWSHLYEVVYAVQCTVEWTMDIYMFKYERANIREGDWELYESDATCTPWEHSGRYGK